MTRVIINADDYGLTKGINEGTIKAYQDGILTSATAMMNGNAVEEAFQLASENPGLGVGIHFVLTYGRPLSSNVPSLTDEEGNFLKCSILFNKKLDPNDIEKELRLQLEKFMSFGAKPTHIDSHHHSHKHEDVYPIVKKIAAEIDVPVRRVEAMVDDSDAPVTTDVMAYEFYGPEVSEELILRVLDKYKDLESVEIMTHPAVVDEKIREISSYCDDREEELEILSSPSLRVKIEELGVQLINFTDLRK